MIKIGLITIHWANNYGASLQTYATVEALKKFGDVTLLDYRAAHAEKGMKLIRWGFGPRDILRIGKDILRLLPRYRVIRKFTAFTYSLPLSRLLIDQKDLASISEQFDLIVCGSDQIWNPNILGEKGMLDQNFMLGFVGEKSKISYASSTGGFRYTDEQKINVNTLLSDFKHISVRESDTASYLNSFLNKNVTSVLDPTLLHNHDEWLNFLGIEKKYGIEPFVLVYALNKDALLRSVIEFYRVKMRIKIVAIDQDPFINFNADKHIKDASPSEFVKLFSQASFVVTNSFHGVCFSINFHKNFVVTTPLSGQNRITNLLEKTGLQNRFIEQSDAVKMLEEKINYKQAGSLLNNENKSSWDFLEKAINNI